MEIENFLKYLKGVQRTGNRYMAKCPAHDDKNPSLSIAEGEDGRILLNCHAGCSTDKAGNRTCYARFVPKQLKNCAHISKDTNLFEAGTIRKEKNCSNLYLY